MDIGWVGFIFPFEMALAIPMTISLGELIDRMVNSSKYPFAQPWT